MKLYTTGSKALFRLAKCKLAAPPTALAIALVIAAPSAWTQTLKVLHTFTGAPDGQNPGGLIDVAGDLYGVTNAGGTGSCKVGGVHGCGTVFKMTGAGKLVWRHSFNGNPDGAFPGIESLLTDGKGDFYGTTAGGGSGSCEDEGVKGCGTVFVVTSAGGEKVLYSFEGGESDGSGPVGGLVRDSSGNLYGTTSGGGDGACQGGCGTVFMLTSALVEKVLYEFQGGTDALGPIAGLVRDSAGNLYGATTGGGLYGGGTVFVVSSAGEETVLVNFNPSDPTYGYYPYGSLAMESGNLYGTTLFGASASCGKGDGCGAVFELAAGNSLTLVHAFAGGSADGSSPFAGVVVDAKGDLYGTTTGGGADEEGAVFEIEAGGTTEKLLVSLNGTTDGLDPYATLALDTKGDLYGTTFFGGSAKCGGGQGCGTVFEVVQ
jgi:uncharacterized repeat protein (TIGR03803 family)